LTLVVFLSFLLTTKLLLESTFARAGVIKKRQEFH
jgi:hypothetical protein